MSEQSSDKRLGHIVGDRACVKCQFNLVGQPIFRERHYDMTIVRCPECGTVAALQEYPLLGRWANRWAMLLAALWLLVLLGGLALTANGLVRAVESVAQATSRDYAMSIAEHHHAWALKQTGGITNFEQLTGTLARYRWLVSDPSPQSYIDTAWWKSVDSASLYTLPGNFWATIRWSGLWLLVPHSIWIFAIGVLWAVAFIGVRRKVRLFLLMLIPIALGGTYSLLQLFSFLNDPSSVVWSDGGTITRASWCAGSRIGPWTGTISYIAFWLALGLGACLGRFIARLLVRALLPPRLRVPLATLWLADGLELPRPSHSPRSPHLPSPSSSQ